MPGNGPRHLALAWLRSYLPECLRTRNDSGRKQLRCQISTLNMCHPRKGTAYAVGHFCNPSDPLVVGMGVQRSRIFDSPCPGSRSRSDAAEPAHRQARGRLIKSLSNQHSGPDIRSFKNIVPADRSRCFQFRILRIFVNGREFRYQFRLRQARSVF